MTPWTDETFAVLDFETTPQRGVGQQVCEIGAVSIRGGRVNTPLAYATLINPQCPMHWAARKKHGISSQMVANAPTLEQEQQQLWGRLGRKILIAHGAHFEMGILQRLRPDYAPIVLDTQIWARSLHPKLYSLPKLIEHYRLHPLIPPHPKGRELMPHRAYYDAVATALLFVLFVQRHIPRTSLNELRSLCEYKRKNGRQ